MAENHEITITTTGSAGSATGTATDANLLSGIIERISVEYHASAPATTKLVINYTLPNGEVHEIVNVTGNTDLPIVPVIPQTDEAGVALVAGTTSLEVAAYASLVATVTLSDALTDVVHIVITVA